MNRAAESDPPYALLTPDTVIDAVEAATGVYSDGRQLALNSYENRVYQVGIEESLPVIVKFYRPQRWSDEAILEEHGFSAELAAQEIPVVAPIQYPAGTLLNHAGFRYAVFPRQGGRSPELDDRETRLWLGRFIGRIHAVGASGGFQHRHSVSVQRLGYESREYLLENDWLPAHLIDAFTTLTADMLAQIEGAFQRAGSYNEIRLHGDCHPGNILWTDDGPHFVDLDDCQTGPAIQDLWMLLSGDRESMTAQLADIMEGYQQFHHFNARELHLVHSLAALRMLHYAAWLARRWHDPAFPMAFPWFDQPRYWEELILGLREQSAMIDELPLPV